MINKKVPLKLASGTKKIYPAVNGIVFGKKAVALREFLKRETLKVMSAGIYE